MDNDLEQKNKLVDKIIDDFSVDLSGSNFGVENDIKNRIREIFLDNDFASSDKRAQDFIKILSKDETEIKTETIIKAKEVSLGINNWIGNNIDAVRTYRSENLTEKLIEETKKNNPGISEDKLRSVRRLSQNINEFYNGDGGVENLQDEVIKEFGVESAGKTEGESVGKIRNSWNDTKGIVGVLRQSPQKLDSLIAENEQIEKDLDGVKLPYQQNEKLASYDRVMNSIKNPEMRKFIESARSKFQTIDRISGGKFGQITNKFINNPTVKVVNGFAAKISNQATSSFVQNSMNSLLKNGISGGIKSITNGMMKKGVELAGKTAMNMAAKVGMKSAAVALKSALGAAFGAATGGLGTVVMAVWEGLKLAGKFIGNLISSLGLELTNNKFADTTIVVVIFIFVLLFGLNQSTANNVSSLVPEIETEYLNHGEISYTEDGRIKSCGVGMETDFYRGKNTTMVSPENISISSRSIEEYNNELKEFIGDNYSTQCGVVYAAQYLAYEFNFWVPYSFGGVRDIGIHPSWGTPHDDGHGHKYEGVDCASFRGWAYDNGLGYRPDNNGEIPFGDCERIKAVIEPGDSLQINGDSYHTAIVLAYNETEIKFAHSGSLTGVTTGTVNICTGRQIGEGRGNNFTHLQKRNYPASRGEQKPDDQIAEEEQKPEFKTTETGHKTDDKGEFLDLTSGLGLNYSLYLPANYDSNKKYPLLVFLHGIGQTGNDLNILYNNSNTVPGILKGGNYYDAIIVSPQSPNSWGSARNYGRVMPLINEIMDKYSVDTERISLTAHSDGVWGLWAITRSNPDFFSVVVPIASSSGGDSPDGLTSTKIWSYYMTGDGTPTTNKSALIQAINSAGGDAKVTRIEGGHGSTRLVYIGAEPVLELMLSQINSNK
ncbi:MAG: hypothetical protein PHX84_02730 [Candidatus Shapirobacteria bacterium]|nr:hypothetical protein [Candidatus Shapirobacteria bacterium]